MENEGAIRYERGGVIDMPSIYMLRAPRVRMNEDRLRFLMALPTPEHHYVGTH